MELAPRLGLIAPTAQQCQHPKPTQQRRSGLGNVGIGKYQKSCVWTMVAPEQTPAREAARARVGNSFMDWSG